MTLSIEPIKASHIECTKLLQPEIVLYVWCFRNYVGLSTQYKHLVFKSDTTIYWINWSKLKTLRDSKTAPKKIKWKDKIHKVILQSWRKSLLLSQSYLSVTISGTISIAFNIYCNINKFYNKWILSNHKYKNYAI